MGRDVFKKAGEKRNWISKIQGLFFGGPKSPLLHPSVTNTTVARMTVAFHEFQTVYFQSEIVWIANK